MSLQCHLCARVTAHTLQTKVLEVRLEIEGPQAEQLKTAPCGQTLQDKVDDRSEEELSPA